MKTRTTTSRMSHLSKLRSNDMITVVLNVRYYD